MKIPRKKELLRLQAKYRTDNKIGGVLGGVPAHLVAYWRKKKKIPDCELPKYTQKQIKSLWETWGSDKQAAAQLGITPAAFYKWRQKYGLKYKPKTLKFSQLQLNLFGEVKGSSDSGRHTLLEKLAAYKLDQKRVRTGEGFVFEPDLVLLNSDWEKLLRDCQALGLKRVKRAERVWGVIPYRATSNGSADNSLKVREFLKEHQIKNVLFSKEGFCLQLLWEKCALSALGLAVGADPAVAGVGFLGSWGVKLSTAELAQGLESGRIEMEIPQSVKISLQGKVNPGTFAADIYSFLTQQIRAPVLAGRVIEISGQALDSLSLSQRMSLALLWTQQPIKGVLLPVDQTIRRAFLSRLKKSVPLMQGDDRAEYAEQFEFDLSLLEPQISFSPNSAKIVPVRQIKRKAISQIVLGAGCQGRLEELEIACRILSRHRVHPEVELLVVPTSRSVFLAALKKGYLRTLLEAGCILCDPGLETWERRLSCSGPILTTGRLSNDHAQIFQPREVLLASPATAAASAIRGEITDPRDYL